jgi:ABC-2 type transport system ATP-binding protein
MDEAERCQRIAYLAWGRLVLEGTVEEVVARSGLVAWSVVGPDLAELRHRLRDLPGVEMVASLGNLLRVTGTDHGALATSLAPIRADSRYQCQPSQPSLEDVFIHSLARLDRGER